MSAQSFYRCPVLAVLLIISPLLLAGASGPRQLVAPVESTSGVAISGVPAQTHDALFAGDVLSTPAGASALVKFSSLSQATVLEDSSVQFRLDPAGRPIAQISSGTVSARATAKNAVVIRTSKYRIEPGTVRAAIYLVGVLPDQRTIVEARQGNVSITEVRSGERYLLQAGTYILMDASAAGLPGQEEEKNQQAPGKPAGQATPPPSPPPKQPKPATKPIRQPWHIGSLSHGASIALILAVAAGGAAGAVAAAAGGGGPSASPSSP
jgi:hypothetical protein